jgi:hypothetical protein
MLGVVEYCFLENIEHRTPNIEHRNKGALLLAFGGYEAWRNAQFRNSVFRTMYWVA